MLFLFFFFMDTEINVSLNHGCFFCVQVGATLNVL